MFMIYGLSILSITICAVILLTKLCIYLLKRVHYRKVTGTIKGFSTPDEADGYFYSG